MQKLIRKNVMYDYIKGTLEELSPAEAVVECHGIGFKLQISLNTYDRLQGQKEVRLYVQLSTASVTRKKGGSSPSSSESPA